MEGETKSPPLIRHSKEPPSRGKTIGGVATGIAAATIAGLVGPKFVESSTTTPKPLTTPSMTEPATPGRTIQTTQDKPAASATSPTRITPPEGTRSISVPPQTSNPETQAPQEQTNEAEIIEEAVKPQLDKLIDPQVHYTISEIKTYEKNTWAVMEINNPDAGLAVVIVKKEKGKWIIVDGPGTYLDPQLLQEEGVPQSVIIDANNFGSE